MPCSSKAASEGLQQAKLKACAMAAYSSRTLHKQARSARPANGAQAKVSKSTPTRDLGQMCVAKMAMPYSMLAHQTHIGIGCKGIFCCKYCVRRRAQMANVDAGQSQAPKNRPANPAATNLPHPAAESPDNGYHTAFGTGNTTGRLVANQPM